MSFDPSPSIDTDTPARGDVAVIDGATADIEKAIETALSTLETVALTRATGKGIKADAKAMHRLTQGADVALFAAHNRAAAKLALSQAETQAIDAHGRAMACQAAGCYSAPIASLVAVADTSYTISSVQLEGKPHALRRDWLALRDHLVGMLANKVGKDGTEKPASKAVASRVNAALAQFDAITAACESYRQQLHDGTTTARLLLNK